MVTFGPPMMLTTEPPALSKIQKLSERVVLAFSGSVPDGEEFLALTRARIGAVPKQPMSAIADAAKIAYAELKKKRAEETILTPLLGVNFAGLQSLIAQSAASQVLQQVFGMLHGHNLQLEALIAGSDDTGHHLFVASHPGQVLAMNSTGFTAVGSGALHAAIRLSLGQHTPNTSLIDGVYNVYEAKRAAEVAPGVGKMTDIAILKDGAIFDAPESMFKLLEELHKERPGLAKEEQGKLKAACNECFKPTA